MYIQRVSNGSPKFQSNINKFGDDDLVSQSRRSWLRENIVDNSMPYYEIIGQEKRLEEYELKKLVASLCGQKLNQDSLNSVFQKLKPRNSEVSKSVSVPKESLLNNEAIENLSLMNLALVSKKLGVYRGQTLNGNFYALNVLKQAGIERIVDLAGYEGLEETCEKMGLEYLYYSTPSYYFIQGQMFKTEEICKNDAKHQTLLFNYTKEDAEAAINRSVERWHKYLDKEINDFIKFIQTMQKGNLYIGCEFGTYTTENALMLNAHFNPLFLRGQKFISTYNRVLTPKLINLYKNLTIEHKQLLGWTKEYDQLVLKRLQSYVR